MDPKVDRFLKTAQVYAKGTNLGFGIDAHGAVWEAMNVLPD